MPKQKKIIVGLSGGVDSAVSAYLLKKRGYDVSAVFMKNYTAPKKIGKFPWQKDKEMARRVAQMLNIPFQVWNFEKEYQKSVIDYLYREYKAGRTPNPDIKCNNDIKFDVFLKRAKKNKADFIATGHYAGIRKSADGMLHLLKGQDLNKDQSYFLAGLNQKQLAKVIFPLQNLTKPEVRKLAKKIGLPNWDKKDSQGICFVGEVKIEDFLKRKIKPRPGLIVNVEGQVLGRHKGIYHFTIGQRKGLDLGGGPARYVIAKDIKNNRLIVGEGDDLALYSKRLKASKWHWLATKHTLPLKAQAKVRYRQNDQSCTVNRDGSVSFIKPQRAIASGQTVAIYKGQELIASGVIV